MILLPSCILWWWSKSFWFHKCFICFCRSTKRSADVSIFASFQVKMASESTQDPFDLQHPSGSPPQPSASSQKSWRDLQLAVRNTRKLGTAMMCRMPHTFTFRHIETADGIQTRLYFLGVPQGSRENTLLYVDVPQQTDPETESLEWQPLLDAFQATPQHGQFSKEEQLLRERKRVGILGITSYEFDERSAKLIFPACNSLFYCKDSLSENRLWVRPSFESCDLLRKN